MKLTELLTNPRFTRKIFRGVVLVLLIAIAVIFGLFNSQQLFAVFNTLTSVFFPFFLGICIAFVLNVILKMYEEHIFAPLNRKNFKIWNRCRRMVCICLSYLTVFAALTAVIFFVIPELIDSLSQFFENVPTYFQSAETWVIQQLERLNVDPKQIDLLQIDWSTVISQASQMATDFMGNLYTTTVTVASSVANGMFSLVMSMIFSVYMLSKKEHLIRGVRRILFAFLPAHRARRVVEIGAITNRIFSGFVAGQLTESLILGCLCYVGMSIIQLPYALLISTLVCVFSLIPLLGAYLGVFSGALILLLATPWGSFPWDSLWFVIFLLLLQQFEGNVIYPRVVGTSIGLPGIWVLLAVVVCSGLMGIPGILIGIPATSVLYALFTQSVKKRLEKRHITDEQLDEAVDVEELLGRPAGGPLTGIKESRKRKKRAQLAKLLEKTQNTLHKSESSESSQENEPDTPEDTDSPEKEEDKPKEKNP